MFKAVMHGNVWPAADVVDYTGRLAFRWTYSVAEWRCRGRRKFARLVREAAAKELAEADYSVYDLSPLRCLIGDDGGRFRRLLRAADVTLKERRKLVLVPRECPLSTLHLRNLATASELGAVVIPPVPAYYNHPQTVEDVNRQIAEKVLSQFGLDEVPEWTGMDV